MKIPVSLLIVFALLLLSLPVVAADSSSAGNSPEFLTIVNQKTGLTWRFYHTAKGNRKLPIGFCEDPVNHGGSNWRLPVKKEFETLINDPEFSFPTDIASEYYSIELRNTFGHKASAQEIISMGGVYTENSDALVFNIAKKKWNWRFVTNEYSVACVTAIK